MPRHGSRGVRWNAGGEVDLSCHGGRNERTERGLACWMRCLDLRTACRDERLPSRLRAQVGRFHSHPRPLGTFAPTRAVRSFHMVTPDMSYTAHPTAVIDEGCTIGEGTRIWHFSHIMPRLHDR